MHFAESMGDPPPTATNAPTWASPARSAPAGQGPLFHAREHVHDLARRLEFMLGDQKEHWLAARLEDLDYGYIDIILARSQPRSRTPTKLTCTLWPVPGPGLSDPPGIVELAIEPQRPDSCTDSTARQNHPLPPGRFAKIMCLPGQVPPVPATAADAAAMARAALGYLAAADAASLTTAEQADVPARPGAGGVGAHRGPVEGPGGVLGAGRLPGRRARVGPDLADMADPGQRRGVPALTRVLQHARVPTRGRESARPGGAADADQLHMHLGQLRGPPGPPRRLQDHRAVRISVYRCTMRPPGAGADNVLR